mmetsp:Transcript_34906/g.86666  ORF Transcript_34906/g.86666 Transcript_34906/m.86666 type:complete len:213 (+) Transcript_34906:1735-2373(+)
MTTAVATSSVRRASATVRMMISAATKDGVTLALRALPTTPTSASVPALRLPTALNAASGASTTCAGAPSFRCSNSSARKGPCCCSPMCKAPRLTKTLSRCVCVCVCVVDRVLAPFCAEQLSDSSATRLIGAGRPSGSTALCVCGRERAVCVGQRTHTTHTHAPLHTEDVTVNLGERRVCGGSCVRRHDACHPHPHAPLSVCLSVCLSGNRHG